MNVNTEILQTDSNSILLEKIDKIIDQIDKEFDNLNDDLKSYFMTHIMRKICKNVNQLEIQYVYCNIISSFLSDLSVHDHNGICQSLLLNFKINNQK